MIAFIFEVVVDFILHMLGWGIHKARYNAKARKGMRSTWQG